MSADAGGLTIETGGCHGQEREVVCAWCGRVKDSRGQWHVLRVSGSEFTHGICPTCLSAQLAHVATLVQ